MNLTTIGNIPSSKLKRLKSHYGALACGLTLAAVLAGVTHAGSSDTSRLGIPARESATLSVPERGPDQHIIFIAGSERQALDQQASVFQDIEPRWYSAYTFIVASNADEDLHAQFAMDEAAREDSGVSMRVIDLRGTGVPASAGRSVVRQPLSASVSGDGSNQLADADLAAAVLSTEMATYDWTAAAPRQVSQADIAASVLVQPMFGTAADAEFAGRIPVEVPALPSLIAAQPMFGTAADAEMAMQSLR